MKIRIYDAGRRNEPKSGYGLMSAQISANLKALGHEVCFFPREGDTEDVALWIRPPHYAKYPEFEDSKKNVFYTMHEEETFSGWKSDWATLLNKCDAIIVPTKWNKEVFQRNLVIVPPIHVIPLGVNSKDFHGAKTYRFSTLVLHDALGSDNSREDWRTTIKAYYKAFADTEFINDVLLTIKSYNIKRDEYYAYLTELQKGYQNVPPIDIVELDLTAQGLNSLYSTHWLFIKNAKREGWSLPLLEAMACGLNVIFADIPVLEWAKDYKNHHTFPLGDEEALVEAFLHEHKQWQKRKGWINLYSWKKCTEQVEEILKNV